MKAIFKSAAEVGLSLQDTHQPELNYGEVSIRINKTAICGTDVHIYQWDDWAKKTIPYPMVIGHEFSGVVEAIGDGVKAVKVGDRVSGEGHITCGYCRNCRAGQRHLCRRTIGVGVNRPGAFAEYLVLPESNVYHLPDNVSDEEAALLDPYGNAVHASLAFDLVGEDVLITGAGPIGLMSAAIARHVGARHVVVTDVNPYRLALAEKMGASVAVNTTKTPLADVMKQLGMTEGFDIGLEMSGHPGAFVEMLTSMNHGGKIAFLGLPKNDFAINWHDVIFKSITIQGIYGRRMFETWYKGISMLQSGLDIRPVITDELPYTEFDKGFQKIISGESGKILLDWR